jgi:hypothetical protein
MRLLNRRSQNPFPDLVRLFFAPRGMIRRVQPHLENRVPSARVRDLS